VEIVLIRNVIFELKVEMYKVREFQKVEKNITLFILDKRTKIKKK